MLVKFLAHGTGSARKAAKYLLGELDAAGREREGVEVLRGDPHQVAAVADTLPFDHKYTSGVIAWAPEDKPTEEQIEAVLDEFEKTAWAGLEPDRYAWAAVLHREEDGGAHVHVLAARCDLETDRSLNIAPPGWEKTFGALQDAFNHEHGWSRPDDPARARVQQPGHRAYVEAAQLRAGLRIESSPRDLIRDYLLQRVEHGAVKDRFDVVAALREAGLEVPRQGKNYLTAMDPETGKRWRLKGELYAFDFDRKRLDRAAAEAAGERTQGDRGVDRERARTARQELAARREERAAYHRARYGGGGRADTRVAPQGLAQAAGRRPGSLARHLRRKLGDDALAVEDHRRPVRDPRGGERADSPGARDHGGDGGDDLGRRVPGDQRGAVRAAACRHAGPTGLHHGRAALHEAVERVRKLYDRIGTAVDGGLEEVVRAVREGTAAAIRTGRSLAAACRAADRGERHLEAANRAAERAGDALERRLRDARRDVARRRLEITPPRGPERDSGPSR